MVIFQPQHISQLLTVNDVSALGRWIALLSQNLQQSATALVLEMPRPGVGIMTVTTNAPGAGYLFYFQLQKGVKIAPKKTLKSTFVLVAAPGEQAQLMAKLRAGLNDPKFVHKLHSLRSKESLYNTIVAKFQVAWTAPTTPLVLPNEKLDPATQPELDLPLVVQTAPGANPERTISASEATITPTDRDQTPAVVTETVAATNQQYFASADFNLPNRAPTPTELGVHHSDHAEDETEYLLRYYEPGAERALAPTFPETKYFLNTVPEPFLVLRRFGDYVHRSLPGPSPAFAEQAPAPFVAPEPSSLAAEVAIAPVIEAAQAQTVAEAVVEPEVVAVIEEESLVPSPVEVTAPALTPALTEVDDPSATAMLTAPAFAETTFATATSIPVIDEPSPVPDQLVLPELKAFATTAPEAITFLEQDSEHLFDPSAFSAEDLAWLKAELPDPSLGMDLDFEPSGAAGLIDLSSGFRYLERDWVIEPEDQVVGPEKVSVPVLSDSEMVWDETKFVLVSSPDPVPEKELEVEAEIAVAPEPDPMLDQVPESVLIPATVVEPEPVAESSLVTTTTSATSDEAEWVYWEPAAAPAAAPAEEPRPITTPTPATSAPAPAQTVRNILVILAPSTPPAQTAALSHWLMRLNDSNNYRLAIEVQPGPTRFTRDQVRSAHLVLYTANAKRLRRFNQSLCYEVDPVRLSAHPLALILAGLQAVAQTPARRWWQRAQRHRESTTVPRLLPPTRAIRP